MALIGVLLLGGAIVMLSATVMVRGNAQFGNTTGDRNWEHALAAAEAGLNWGLATVEGHLEWGIEWDSGDEVPQEVVGTGDERAWAIAAADGKDGAFVASTPIGEFVVIKPLNAAMVYGVGYAPSRDAVNRRVRVVRAGYEIVPTEVEWVTNLAVLTEDDLEIVGKPSFYTGATIGIHTNGFLTLGGSTNIDGCMSASSGAQMGGSVIQGADCPMPGNQPRRTVPLFDARERWPTSTHDLCPDGSVRAGPNHATLGGTAGEEPCTGQIIHVNAKTTPYNGWKFEAPGIVEKWFYDANVPNDGVYYVHHNSARIESSPGSSSIPWLLTLITTSDEACPNAVAGDIWIEGSPTIDPYPDTGNLLLVASRDIVISGSPKMSGVIAAGEQIYIDGEALVTLGTYVSASTCDTPGSPASANYISGNASVNNITDVETDLIVVVDLIVLEHWAELRS
jgi:hypothetical protein